MKFTAGRERYMMHCNDIEKCMADQSPKGMKKGLHLFAFLFNTATGYIKKENGIRSLEVSSYKTGMFK